MKNFKVLGFLAAALATLPATSFAQAGYLSNQTELRAGPGLEYPEVAILPPGLAISVQGCVSDYSWCDVLAGPDRGWLYGGYIVYPYQGTTVPVLTYGALLGLGIVAFSVGHYWDNYYVGRPWYPQRQLWINRPPPVHYGHGAYPPPHGYRPPGAHPPPGYRPPGGHPPQSNFRPPNGQRPQQGQGGKHPQGQGGGQRPTQQAQGGGQRPPQQGQGGGQRQPQQGGQGGGQRQQKNHGQGAK